MNAPVQPDEPIARVSGGRRQLPPRRAAFADALGLVLLALLLLDHLPPSLILLDTLTAGGDTPCHIPTLAYFNEVLLPQGRLHGWYPGSYLGHPLLLYYFPLPFLLMAALTPPAGLAVAFKLGTVLCLFGFPFLTYGGFRGLGFRFPTPLMGAAAATVFLFLEDNPIWGGTIASTLAGEFSYMYGIGFAVLFLGGVYRAYSRGSSPWGPAALLALTALAHGYAVLWAGLSAAYFLYGSRRPLRTLGWLGAVALLAFGFVAFWLLPLLSDWGWTTPFNDAWITVDLKNLVPRLLWPLFLAALAGLAVMVLRRRASGGADHRLLFLLHAALCGAALAAAGPALGIIDVRFLPFAQLSLSLLGAAAVGWALQALLYADLAALGVVLLAIVYAETTSTYLRHWIDWNYTGLEAKELWPAFRDLTARLQGRVGDPRVAIEYSVEHERAGSIRMYEAFPHFSGRPTLEGLYNQASIVTHPIYYLTSELCERSPNPFRHVEFGSFDTENALKHLRLFNAFDVVALSAKLSSALEARSDVIKLGRIPPYALFRLSGQPGYVEPLQFAPVRSSWSGWREKSLRWFSRAPQTPAHLVFSADARFGVVERDEWLPPPLLPLEPGVSVRESVSNESIAIETSRVGHPLLVKVSYHPRWRAVGASGPYLVTPGLMMVIPTATNVKLAYSSNWADRWGTVASVATLLAAVALPLARFHRAGRPVRVLRLPAPLVAAGAFAGRAGLRWGGIIPAGVLSLLFAGRLLPAGPDPQARRLEGAELLRRAVSAHAAGRLADAAEYARYALARSPSAEALVKLRMIRGEGLLRSGDSGAAVEMLEPIAKKPAAGAHVPRALELLAEAYAAEGRAQEAAEARREAGLPAKP
jgi:hypothetical protein